MNLAVYICLREKMKGLRFESSNANLHVSNGVGVLVLLHIRNTRQHGPFEVRKISVLNTKTTFAAFTSHM